jgi:hypothetical protein
VHKAYAYDKQKEHLISLIKSNFVATPNRQQRLEESAYTKEFDFMNKKGGNLVALREKRKKD